MGLNHSIYLDSCVAIYLVEEHPVYATHIEQMLATSDGATLCHSPLVELESLVLPLRQRQDALIRKFHRFFLASKRLSMTDDVFALATELRARHGLKTPDALHLAAAIHHGCNALWTNDNRLALAAPGVAINVLHVMP
jgi:predicted nucleic acid-binding protein